MVLAEMVKGEHLGLQEKKENKDQKDHWDHKECEDPGVKEELKEN